MANVGAAELTREAVSAGRAAVRSLDDGRKVSTDDDAALFVDQRGIAPLMHLAGCELPSLSEADIRDPWEGFDITDGAWRWKEILPQTRRCAYGKFLRGRGFFISWRLFPAFYRLRGRPQNAADGPSDHAGDFADGLLGRLEWAVLEAVDERGPIDSRRLWRELKRTFGGNRSRFEQALTTLQAGFRVMVAGGDLAGWSMHRWELVERQAPAGLLRQLPDQECARQALVRQYTANTVVCTTREIAGFFGWSPGETADLCERLRAAGALREVTVDGWKGTWWSTAGSPYAGTS